MLVVLKKPNDSVSFMFPSVIEFVDVDTFRTESISKGFPMHLNKSEYYKEWKDENHFRVKFVKVYQPITIYELTNDESECVLLAISYYLGTDYSKVTPLGNNVFIKHENVRATNRDKITGEDVYGYHNEILNYIGLSHIEVDNPKYEGERHTKIQLTDKCKFQMYKLKENISN